MSTIEIVTRVIGWVFGCVGIVSAIFSYRNLRLALKKFEIEQKERDKKHDDELIAAARRRDSELKETAKEACREFTNSDDYRDRKDERSRAIAEEVVAQAFVDRAKSFVDAELFKEFRRSLDQQFANLNQRITDNTKAVSEYSGKVPSATDIAMQVNALVAAQFPTMVRQTVAQMGDDTQKGKVPV